MNDVRKTIHSHSEKDILIGCLSLLDSLYREFLDYLEFMGIEWERGGEDEPVFRMSNFSVVQRLFLWETFNSGGTSTTAKCTELGVDYSEQILFKPEYEEDD